MIRMSAALAVLSAGLLTTLQDLGRVGYQHLGIPVSGALDPVSLNAANLLVGNPPDTAALEIAYQGPTLAVETDSVRIACAGAAAPIEIVAGGEPSRPRPLAMLRSARLKRGDRLRIRADIEAVRTELCEISDAVVDVAGVRQRELHGSCVQRVVWPGIERTTNFRLNVSISTRLHVPTIRR